MTGKHVLTAAIYSSVLVLGMTGSAIAQDSAAKQGATGSAGAQGGAPTQQQGAANQQKGEATQPGGTTAQSDTATQPGATTGGTGMAQGGDAAQGAGGPALETGLVGMEVRNGQNEVIGEVANVLVTQDGRIEAILLGAGGVLGIGEDQYVVPWDRVQAATGQGYVRVDVPADQVEAEFSLFEPQPAPAGAGAGAGTGTGTGMGSGAPSQQMQKGAGGAGSSY